jgi:hypothetical protein
MVHSGRRLFQRARMSAMRPPRLFVLGLFLALIVILLAWWLA